MWIVAKCANLQCSKVHAVYQAIVPANDHHRQQVFLRLHHSDPELFQTFTLRLGWNLNQHFFFVRACDIVHSSTVVNSVAFVLVWGQPSDHFVNLAMFSYLLLAVSLNKPIFIAHHHFRPGAVNRTDLALPTHRVLCRSLRSYFQATGHRYDLLVIADFVRVRYNQWVCTCNAPDVLLLCRLLGANIQKVRLTHCHLMHLWVAANIKKALLIKDWLKNPIRWTDNHFKCSLASFHTLSSLKLFKTDALIWCLLARSSKTSCTIRVCVGLLHCWHLPVSFWQRLQLTWQHGQFITGSSNKSLHTRHDNEHSIEDYSR